VRRQILFHAVQCAIRKLGSLYWKKNAGSYDSKRGVPGAFEKGGRLSQRSGERSKALGLSWVSELEEEEASKGKGALSEFAGKKDRRVLRGRT